MDLGIVCRATQWLYLKASPALQATHNHSVNAAGRFEDFTIGFGGTATAGVSL